MNRKVFLVSLGLMMTLTFFSCKKKPEGPTDIRIRNKTTKIFEGVDVDTSVGEYNFGDVDPGKETAYHLFDKAYRQAHITLKIDSVQYELVPVDYTYEVPLGRGKYTYELSVADTIEHILDIHIIADAPLK